MLDKLVDAINELQGAVAGLRAENAALRARLDRMFRPGKVTDVSDDGTKYRQEIGVDDDGNPVKGPWIPHSQMAGALKVHAPVAPGQQMMMVAPNGDAGQAFGIPLTWSDSNSTPGQGKSQNALTFGPFTFRLNGEKWTVDGPQVEWTCNVKVTGNVETFGSLRNNDQDVGSTHKHVDVMPGGGMTGPPA